MLNVGVRNLNVRLLDEVTYLLPTEGDLDRSRWYEIIDGKVEDRVLREPTTPTGQSFTYSGEMRNGLPHGKGEAKYKDDTTYEGAFQRGLRNGVGKLTSPEGWTHEGNFLDGKAHGRGKRTYQDGSYYDGPWENDLKHGHGIFVDAEGNQRTITYSNGEDVGSEF